MVDMTFGFLIPSVDAHTLGASSAMGLVRDAGCQVLRAPDEVTKAILREHSDEALVQLVVWLRRESITNLCVSFRLDEAIAVQLFTRMIAYLERHCMFALQGGSVRAVAFAGLPAAAAALAREFGDRFTWFFGSETPRQTLGMLGVPSERWVDVVDRPDGYDASRFEWARQLIDSGSWAKVSKMDLPTRHNSPRLVDRIDKRRATGNFDPLLRFHMGPYSENRAEALQMFYSWLSQLRDSGLVDVASIGSSQLTQEKFDKDWSGLPNGGGVPIRTAAEFGRAALSAGDMLLRAYSGTNNVASYAQMLEETIDNCWHTLSLWWFNRLDGRGPLSLEEGLRQHFAAIDVAVQANKPFEPNVGHHFSFRGSDDVTAVVATALAVRAAAKRGIRTIVLQVMLNTPKSTAGVVDIAKVRALLDLLKPVTASGVKILLQPRAGLSYFAPDLDLARIQLAACTALMADLVQPSEDPAPIVHVVSYSEGVALADPSVMLESARITLDAWRKYRRDGVGRDLLRGRDAEELAVAHSYLGHETKELVMLMEDHVPDLYTPTGLESAFSDGWLPVPELWHDRERYPAACDWITSVRRGQVKLVDEVGKTISVSRRAEIILARQ